MIWDSVSAGLLVLGSNLWLVPLGVIIGIVIGATPGLGPSTTLAILLPALITFPPEVGLILGVSIYVGAEVGNSYPAILLNVPGTPSAAITTVEGYPMAQRGEAARALGISIMASTIGGLFAGILALVGAPFLAIVSLKFSPVEVCILIIFGLAMIGQMSTGGLLKGLGAGLLGLVFATVGADPIYGELRGTFGNIHLFDGLPVSPVLVGLLGFSEMLVIAERGLAKYRSEQTSVGLQGILAGFRDVLSRPIATAKGGIMGLLVGILPGAGGSVAAVVAYQQALASASVEERKQFGHGSPVGLLAVDSSNNGVVAGALIPLLTLGIPGSATTAVLLVIMGYHGLAVGPTLFMMNGDIAYAVLWTVLVSTVFMFFLSTLLANAAYRVASISLGILLPIISIFCLLGGFAEQQRVFDMGTMLAFGILGYIMKKTGYPPVALILGLVLGDKFESNLFQGLRMGLGSPLIFVTRPLALVLWFLLFASLFGSPIIEWIKKRKSLQG